MRFNKDFWLIAKPIAHRGLWGSDIIENTLTAYQKAIDNGYPIEIDIYGTTDGEIVCFHDSTLLRMTGDGGYIYNKSLTELKNLSIFGTNEKIPTLNEVLKLVNGKTPLLIEFKNQPDNSYIPHAIEILKEYKGEFAVQSFNPLIINKIRKLAPEFTRGILASKFPDTQSKIEKFVVKRMPLNFLCKPQFISYDFNGLPLKKSKRHNLPVIAWTVRSKKTFEEIKDFCDNIIFEEFIPE